MKFIPYIKIVLLIACTIIAVAGMASYDSEQPKLVTSGISFMLNFSFVLLLITAAAALLMPIVGIVQNPKNSLKSLMGLGLIVVVFLLAYAMSSADPIPLPSGKMLDNEFELKFSDTALYATYFTFAGVIISIVFGEIYKLFK
ncbi:MAG: hypothetical protein RR980_00545 [Mucinivorans sp.]